ncbi:hypothetical protein COO91_06913 [Nostoc flagelliforme CCNUN1]|uniref:Uncharacterized protein n=1 Tax=Nostoc flagelliforme CCNUN1 TaxID=2038116 RepID=A0A2K8SZK8_9NOSO|nr:hypothetical protein COO91_06913 [Nostoc flagelliforme CCNUN1]
MAVLIVTQLDEYLIYWLVIAYKWGVGSGEEAGELLAGSKGEEFSPQQEQHPAPLPLFNAQFPIVKNLAIAEDQR